MFVKNLLRSGDLLSLVPLGLPATLQYDADGRLQKVLLGYEEAAEDISAKVLPALRRRNIVPLTITIKTGTSFVQGVFYSTSVPHGSGSVEDVMLQFMSAQINNDDAAVEFYAGNVFSYATVFRGGVPIRQWLKLAGFNLLPAYVVPADVSKSIFEAQAYRNSPFGNAAYMYYFTYRSGAFLAQKLPLSLQIVKAVKMTVSTVGFVRGDIGCESASITMSWADVVRFNILEDSVLIIDESANTVVKCFNSSANYVDEKLVKYETTMERAPMIECPYCHKLVRVPEHGQFTCDDPRCVSVQYPRVMQFLEALRLPVIPASRYFQVSEGQTSTSPVDVLDLPEYSSYEVNATPTQILEAIIPSELVVPVSFLDQFCRECDNSVLRIEYYLKSPDRIKTDLNVPDVDISALISWISDIENLNDAICLFHHSKIHVVSVDRRFNGLPILRNEVVYLTGKFDHGTTAEVASILRSYSAAIVNEFSSAVSCVVVGNQLENVNAGAVQAAKNLGVPVISEKDFFEKFDIDSDL